MTANPIPANERSQILDILRGFALLGVMLDNLFSFSGWTFKTAEMKAAISNTPLESILEAAEQILINGKFYSIFSLLFGIGFSVILSRMTQKQQLGLGVFYRRLLILMAIGFIHIYFFWEGDILVLYAMLGLFLPFFRNVSDRALLVTAGCLLASPLLFDALSILFDYRNGAFLEAMAYPIDKSNGIPSDSTFAMYLYKEGAGYAEWQNWQASSFIYRYAYILDSNRIPKVLAMFLIGLYAGRKGIYNNLSAHIDLFKKMRLWGLIIGLPSACFCYYAQKHFPYIPDAQGIWHTLAYALSVVPLCLAYVSVLCLWFEKTSGGGKLALLAPMGRMALSNYLTQTLCGIFIYYGVGLGLGAYAGPSIFIPLGILIYLIQMTYSTWWLRYFNYGPAEWIWRQLTYGKRLAIRK